MAIWRKANELGLPVSYYGTSDLFAASEFARVCRRNMPVTEPFPFDRDGVSILQMAYDAFGSERMMWGSDYPPVSYREGYANSLRFPLAELERKSEAELQAVFGGVVAAKVYGLV